MAYLFLTWWLLTHRLDRFWLPLLPPLAVLAGLGADWIRNRGWSILLGTILTIALVTNLTYISTALAGLNEWTGDLVFLRRDIPDDLESRRSPGSTPSCRRTPGRSWSARRRCSTSNHTVAYNTVFNPETIELLAERQDDPEEFRRGASTSGI